MKPALQLCPVREMGMMKTAVTLEDPVVRLESWESGMPLVTVEEGGVVVELEFVSVETFRSFQRQVARLETEEADHA